MEGNFNRHLGSKLRMRRLALGLTQTKVAQAINVTFQQIQKYEKGTNGISSLRIMQLGKILKVPVIYFFEDYKDFKNINSDELINNEDLNSLIRRKWIICVLAKNPMTIVNQIRKRSKEGGHTVAHHIGLDDEGLLEIANNTTAACKDFINRIQKMIKRLVDIFTSFFGLLFLLSSFAVTFLDFI